MFIRTLLVLAILTSTTIANPDPGPEKPKASLDPNMVVENASPESIERVSTAVTRFTSLGLGLPNLQIALHSGEEDCGGAKGRFSDSSKPWQISICSTEVETVLEHELAHAWERANLSDAIRRAYMEENNYTVWRSHDVPWNERAVEGIAVVIQQGVSGLPLPPALSLDIAERLAAFELLTGRPDPRLHEWLGSKKVACADRPTPLSAEIPDAAGRVCA